MFFSFVRSYSTCTCNDAQFLHPSLLRKKWKKHLRFHVTSFVCIFVFFRRANLYIFTCSFCDCLWLFNSCLLRLPVERIVDSLYFFFFFPFFFLLLDYARSREYIYNWSLTLRYLHKNAIFFLSIFSLFFSFFFCTFFSRCFFSTRRCFGELSVYLLSLFLEVRWEKYRKKKKKKKKNISRSTVRARIRFNYAYRTIDRTHVTRGASSRARSRDEPRVGRWWNWREYIVP